MDELALQGLGPNADNGSRDRAMQYFEQLKSCENGWKLCAQAFTSGTYHSNDHVKFFCLQVVENYLKKNYLLGSKDDHDIVKSFVVALLQIEGNGASQNKNFIRNKVAQVVSLVYVVDYPHRWPTFFSDILDTLRIGPMAVDMYLRILLAIDSEVVDREIIHNQEETQRNTLIKDAMRDQYVVQLAESWFMIMTGYETSHPEITCQCLEVVGKYVSWIDINLVANDRFVTALLRFLNNNLLRESACDCIYEIISKGMDPVAKTKLIESFVSLLESQGVFNPSEDEEGDYLSKLSKLVNGIGVSLILAWQKLVKSNDQENTQITLRALEHKIPFMLRFLGDEDDDVSGAVTGFAQDYIALLKQVVPLTPSQRENVEGLLYTIISKMKFDESYNFEQEGEDEAMFLEYRKQLKVIFNNLALLDTDLLIGTVLNVVTRTLPVWESTDFRDVEIAVYLMYILGEAVPASHGQHFSGNPTKVSALQEMMRLLIKSRVSCQGHTSVLLQFFETVVRYDKFFQCEPEHIPEVLMAFLDERGFRNRSAKVRSRTSYLFSRFVKGLKQHMNSYLEDVLKRIQDLLALNTPDNGYQHLLSDDDQLFIYETAGVLVVASDFPPEKKQELMKNLLAPIASKFEGLLTKLYQENDEDKQLAYAKCVNNAMALASRTSKGFSSQQTMKQCGCIEAFTELLKIFLHALNTPVHRQLLHVGVRQYMHRMVVCLGEEILPFVPIALENLLKQPETKELYDFIPLINQLIMKFKTDITPFLNSLFMPLVSTIFQVISTPSDERDQIAANEKKMLERGYFQFLSTIVSYQVFDVLKAQAGQNLDQVLMSLIQGAVELQDPQSQKMCFNIFRKLIEVWGGNDGILGFADFMYNNIIPACFLAPLKPTFDLTDGQTTLALGESALCLKSIVDKRGEEVIIYLQSDYLPKLNLPPELIQEFCHALRTDSKTFRNYHKIFFTKAKS
ncbi:exportin-T isoform X2 [Patella vulgata]|uniref:exportin-T isoform X2 n=1 Tax=Patella vulgata TaxID=6465 RepID=UPI0024A8EB60|nr:exportin-T isoform X2 [Patella vulgata]